VGEVETLRLLQLFGTLDTLLDRTLKEEKRDKWFANHADLFEGFRSVHIQAIWCCVAKVLNL
jgi:hypothetical protein